jgi:hypothetical protein
MKFLSRVFIALNSRHHSCIVARAKGRFQGGWDPSKRNGVFQQCLSAVTHHLGSEYSFRCVQTFASKLSELHPPEPQCWAAMARKRLIALSRYLETGTLAAKKTHLNEKLAKLASELQRLKAIETEMRAAPDQQISLTDPDFRSMATSGRGSVVVSYHGQVAVDTKTIVILGHGRPVSKKAELTEYRDMLVAIRDNVAKLKQQGRSLTDTVDANPTATFDAKRGQFVIAPDFFTRLVYRGV